VRTEIVVWRRQDDRTVNLKHRLPVLVHFFDIAVFHFPDAFFRNLKCVSEFLIKHETSATVFVFLVGDHGSARRLPRKLERKSGLAVGSAWQTMATVPLFQYIGTTDVQMSPHFCKQVNA